MKKDKTKPEDIMVKRSANFFGFEVIEPDGTKKNKLFVIRGNGTLRLRKDEVFFKRWLPGKAFSIPMKSIVKLDIKRVHNLKTKLLPVLRIHYKEEGELKIFGVCVGFLDETNKWKDEIAKVRAAHV